MELKKEAKATILAHNYQRKEVQEVADFVGDSLELSRKASTVKAKLIVFCGVRFMAETAAVVNPKATVLLPDPCAGCPLADTIDEDSLSELKKEHPRAKVVCYVNSSAAVKAMSDVCCTSANAVDVVRRLRDEEVIFIPDENLGRYVSSATGKEMVLYPGFCPPHMMLKPEMVLAAKERHPGAETMVHPECRSEVVDLADAVLSTSQMLRYAKESAAREFIVGTEVGLIHRLEKENPSKSFYPASKLLVCRDMKLTTLEKVAECIEGQKHAVEVPGDVRARAARAIEKMLVE
ncbi:MAG: quinolinate synthase NadA [Candidatus Brockarchaeota archaeon]|nr:quinolinate synthase NadA [Candidatus Brockarchaeota archaeon]